MSAISALTGFPAVEAAPSKAAQNIGSRLTDVSWPAIVTDLFTGRPKPWLINTCAARR